MNIESEKPKTIYKYTTDKGIDLYSIMLSKKDKDGNYMNGFINCRFKKDVKLEHKTKILIKKAWIDFTLADKKTYPHIFVSEFEIVDKPEESIATPKSTSTYDNENTDIKLNDEDIEKAFNKEDLVLPF